MKPSSESLGPVEARYDWVAEGNCVPARVRGEQSEAKDQPQTRVNSIRPGIVTSQRSKHICGHPGVCGEVRGVSLILSPDIPRYTGTEERCRVVGVRMVRRPHGLNQESRALRGRSAAVRALIVARKRVTTVERRDAGKWMRDGPERRKQSESTEPTGASGGNASTSRRSPTAARPVVVGGTLRLDRTHVDAAHLG